MITVLPKDIEQTPIVGAISSFAEVYTLVVASGVWYQLNTTTDTKQIIIQPRDVVTWRFATVSGTSNYFTVRYGGALAGELATVSGSNIAWVWAESNTTMELLQGK